jgi:hypothetical protein
MFDFLTIDKSVQKKLALLVLLLSIIPFLILAFFCHPAYDDFCYSVGPMKTSFIEGQKAMYNGITGRYFLMALLHFNPLTVGSFVGYQALAALIILLLFISIFSFLDAFLKSSVGRLEKLIGAAFLLGLFSNQMPDVTEAYYLMTSKIAYQLPNVLILFFFALAIRSSENLKRAKLLMTILCCVLIVAIVGCSEISMLILALLVFSVTINLWLEKSKQRWRWLIFSLVTIVCSAVVILAPGNAIRAGLLPAGQHRFFFSLGMSLRQEVSFLLIWFSNFAFVLGTFFFIPVAANISDRIPVLKQLRFHPIICSLLLLLVVFLGLFPAYWTMGMMGQHRTVNAVYFFFLIGWFINILIWVDYLKRKRGFKAAALPAYVYVIGVPLLFCTLLLTNNTRLAIGDIVRGRAYRYDKAVKERYAQFKQCVREGQFDGCPVVTMSELPTTITNPYYETEFDCQEEYWKLEAQSSGRR